MTQTTPDMPPLPRPKKRDLHGWIVLDKPLGMTSTQAVGALKRLFSAKKAGHAGTLDPLATGLLPVAFGEATKTVPFVMDGRKAYTFMVSWGVETNTDDGEGVEVARSDQRPTQAAIEALLPRFIGLISQVPPQFSAIKIAGERAYDLARDGAVVEIAARDVLIESLKVVSHSADKTELEASCGKGTYVRAIARDLGRALGCYGHISALRRTRVGPFTLADSVTIDKLREHIPANALRPIAAGMSELERISVTRDGAARLRRGQSLLLRGADAPINSGTVYASCGEDVVAFGEITHGEFVPHRVFNGAA
jgi:tRNA pseudouridine55 synthase